MAACGFRSAGVPSQTLQVDKSSTLPLRHKKRDSDSRNGEQKSLIE